MPYELGPEFLAELFSKHAIDVVVHGDDPCLLPDGTDAYAYAKKQARALCLLGLRFFGFAAARTSSSAASHLRRGWGLSVFGMSRAASA